MLNLAFAFDDAVRALTEYPDHLAIAPLPATVYLMQVDVINHYNHALDHYFSLGLDAGCLQNSSLGTPYEKWAFFTNQNFERLSFAIHNLLRYTSRLLHESEFPALREKGQFAEMSRTSNAYTLPICELREKPIGIVVHPDHRLSVTAVMERSARSQSFEAAGMEMIDIRDRTRLSELREQGHAELEGLRTFNQAFGVTCDAFYRTRGVAVPFKNMNESFWI